MQTNFEKVLEFHEIFGHPIRSTASLDCPEKFLRYSLIAEEVDEFEEAYAASNLVEMADALGDIIYVVYGAGLTFGLNLDSPSFEVSKSFLGECHSTFNLFLNGAGLPFVNALREALETDDIHDVEVHLVTLLHAALGAADILGISIDEIVEAIHESNLTKLGDDGKPIYREDGKVLKNPNTYQPPTESIRRILDVQLS